MIAESPLLLIGVGTAGSSIARGVCRAFGSGLRYVLADTDATTGQPGEPFALIGGNRLSGHGTGGDIAAGRLAAAESVNVLDEHLEGVRLAVIVTALGGGTGGGATIEVAKHLSERGVPTIVFATTPFAFEGEDRLRNTRDVLSMIEDAASASVVLPLDKLIGDVDNMNDALKRAIDTLASGVTLFWRLVEKPGYLRLDTERLRHFLSGAGRGRFATVTVQGPNRANEVIDCILRSELLATSTAPVKTALCGILAGDDLLLCEVGKIAESVRSSFGGLSFELATVNDEATFSGRLSVVVLLFESAGKTEEIQKPGGTSGGRRRRPKGPLGVAVTGRGRFNSAEPTIWNGEDLDVPTFIRKNLSLDF